MKFNLRFVVSLILIVLIIISFVLITLEILSLNGRKPFEFKEGSDVKDFKDFALNATYSVTKIGTSPDDLVSNTNYYRYSSLLVHVLSLVSAAYIVYFSG